MAAIISRIDRMESIFHRPGGYHIRVHQDPAPGGADVASPAVPTVQIAFAVLLISQPKRSNPAKSVHDSTSRSGVARKTRSNRYDSAECPAHLLLLKGIEPPTRLFPSRMSLLKVLEPEIETREILRQTICIIAALLLQARVCE